MTYPNQLGTAKRSDSKAVRIATHLPVLTECLAAVSGGITVVEHGMGASSTKWFHTQPKVKRIISYEDDVRWMQCDCDLTQHAMLGPWESQAQFKADAEGAYLGFIDGPGDQRLPAMLALFELGIPMVVMHDVETCDKQMIEHLLNAASKWNYRSFQYVALNPETLLCVKPWILECIEMSPTEYVPL